MRKKHPIRNTILLLLAAALVAGLAAMPYLNAVEDPDAIPVSILSGTPQHRTLTKTLLSGGPLIAQESQAVEVPAGVQITEFVAETGQTLKKGDPIALVDDVSVMSAVQAVQETLSDLDSQLKTVRNQIQPGTISVNASGRLCVDGKEISESKLTYHTQYLTLTQQHKEYEELLLELFRLHQSGVVTAPCDGLVADVDKTQLMKLGAVNGGQLMKLARNTPDGDDTELFYQGFIRQVVSISPEGNWNVRTGTTPCIITDFLNLTGIDMTVSEAVESCYPELPVFEHTGQEWQLADVQAGDILLYAFAADNTYWVIRIGNAPVEEPTEPTQPTEPAAPSEPTEPANPTEPTEPVTPTEPTEPDDSQESTEPSAPGENSGEKPGSGSTGGSGSSRPSGSISIPSGLFGSYSGGSSSGKTGQQQSDSLYSTERKQLCTITPMDTMTLELPVDEMDIAAVQPGMEAEITLDALPNQTFAATVTEISPLGSNAGGSSKFTVTLTLPCAENMLPGMNALASLVLETYPDVLTVPVAALTEQGSTTVMFTALDEKTGEPTAPTAVEVGFSDGEYAQLLSGLSENDSFHYTYYDVMTIDTSVETKNSFR